jgi:hypothetical protein
MTQRPASDPVRAGPTDGREAVGPVWFELPSSGAGCAQIPERPERGKPGKQLGSHARATCRNMFGIWILS